MMRLGVALAILGLAGIGCGSREHSESLFGTWGLTVNACAVGFTFRSPAAYEYDLICPTTSGTSGMESEVGTYMADPTRIVFTVDKTTCAGALRAYFLDYSLTADRLSVVYADGVEVLQANEPVGHRDRDLRLLVERRVLRKVKLLP